MPIAHPRENLDTFGLQEGEVVADFGAGPGKYAIEAAKRVGNGGQVYAIEIQQKLVAKVRGRADDAGLDNIDVIWADLEEAGGSTLNDSFVDAVLATNVLFQITDKQQFLSEAKRVLKAGGRMLVVDWSDSHGGLGPPQDHIIDKQEAEALCKQVGFEKASDIDAGNHHYGFVCRKP